MPILFLGGAELLERRWRVPRGLDLELRQVGTSWVVFNPEAGDTHVLNVNTGDLLDRLVAGETIDPGKLAEKNAGADDGSLSLLEELYRLRLIEPA